MLKSINLGLLILRLSVGGLMLLHGIAKLKGVNYIEGLLSGKGFPSFLAYGVYITEIIAPLLIIIGYRTRLASLVYVLGALVAMFLAHAPEVFMLNKHGGWGVELIGMYALGGLALFFTGAGKLSISSSHTWD